MANKIRYGISNVYYAVATIAANGTATYASPVALPGAVSLSMEPQGDRTPFYADNIEYYVSSSNTGYDGTLEVALLTDAFKKNILGYREDTKHVFVEDMEAQPIHFALIFQFEGDESARRHVLYNCTAQRPGENGSTKNETIEPQTESISIRASGIYVSAISKWLVKAETTGTTATADYNSFLTAVYTPSALTT